jgi:ribosomal protein S18 acetylase RimI-like enzyme
MVDIQIRPMTGEAAVCAAFMAESEPWLTLGVEAEYLSKILNEDGFERYVALAGQEVAGVIVIQLEGAFTGYIKYVAVAPPWRNRGVGTALVRLAEGIIFRTSPNAFICASSFNEGARRLYERLGYEVVGEMRDYVVEGTSEILMRKTIGPLKSFTPRT